MPSLLCPEHMRQTKAYLDDNKWPLPDNPDEFAYLAVGHLSGHCVCDVCQAPLSPGTEAAFLASPPAPKFDEDVFSEIEAVHFYGPVPSACSEELVRRLNGKGKTSTAR